MEALPIAVAVGLLIFLGITLALFGISKKRLNLGQRLNREAPAAEEDGAIAGVNKQVERALLSIGGKVPRSSTEMSRQERRLVQAGYRRKDAVMLLNGSHIAVLLLMLVIFATSGYLYRHPVISFVLSLFLGAAIPDMWLRRAITRRQVNIQYGLPDAMALA